MLVATSENRLGPASVRSSLLFERAVRGSLIRREHLAFDTRFAAAAPGRLEPVGHVFLLLAGRLAPDGAPPVSAPTLFVIGDDEFERPRAGSRTFRTDGERVDVVQLRVAARHLRVPIGVGHGPTAPSAAVLDAAAALLGAGDAPRLVGMLDALARHGIVDAALPGTVISEEPDRFRRLWAALGPLYQSHGATVSLKQLAASLGMSMRQVGRDTKELATAFGLGGGYRDTLLVIRLRVAVLMLSAPGATVGDVAALVGYGSPIALARAFRDAKLPSPSAIQAAIRGEGGQGE